MKTILRLFSLFGIFLLISQAVFGQGAATGDLRVTVKDPKGSVVANATVTVKNGAKGLERVGSGDGQGGYSVRQLAPGTYTVTVDAPGFTGVQATNVNITVGQLAELPVGLTVASGKEVVEVTSQAELVETSRTSTPKRLENARLKTCRSTAGTTSTSR
jgi:hypothetical protein